MSTPELSEPLVGKLLARHGGSTPEEAIERFVTRQLRDTRQTHLPVDVDLITSALGIRQRKRDYPFAGRIYADESGQLVMDLSSADPQPRRRFTCAHELLHLAFPGFKQEARYRLDRSTGTYERDRTLEEYLCDYGAALTLMPTELVAGRYRIEDGLAAVDKLSADAEVSLEAAGIRLVRLAVTPCAFVVLQVSHKPADMKRLRRGESVPPELRVKYGVVKQMPFVPRFKSAEPDSPFARALDRDGVVTGYGSLPGAAGGRPVYIEALRVGPRNSTELPQRVVAVARAA